MNYKIHTSRMRSDARIAITGSKSESNRLLILQALYPSISIENLSNSDDTVALQTALKHTSDVIDVHHAGTTMRFLTAYYAIQEGSDLELTGSERMQERPIHVLVEALRELGADIDYMNNEGFPPLRIQGKTLEKETVSLKANVSSQYISALLLIASKLKHGLKIHLEGDITSRPYIEMTLDLLEQIGITSDFEGDTIRVYPKTDEVAVHHLTVESDWSSASYFYSMIALSPVGTKIHLTSYKENSLQGDAILVDIYKDFGVETTFEDETLSLTKTHAEVPAEIHYNLSNAPDLAQTIAVSCLGLGIACHLDGLHTLKIKETDRLVALKNEIEKLGTKIQITNEQLLMTNPQPPATNVRIDTYKDHRMAMAFAPLCLKTDVIINEAEVVTKSYPEFWNDLRALGVNFEAI